MKTCGDCPWWPDKENDCGLNKSIEDTNCQGECAARKAFRVVRDHVRAQDAHLIHRMKEWAIRDEGSYLAQQGLFAAAELQRGFMVAHYLWGMNRLWNRLNDMATDAASLHAEVERLTGELAKYKAANAVTTLMAVEIGDTEYLVKPAVAMHLAKCQKERDRYRRELEEIAYNADNGLRDIARKALKGERVMPTYSPSGEECPRCAILEKEIKRLREFVDLVRTCPLNALHLMPLAAQALQPQDKPKEGSE